MLGCWQQQSGGGIGRFKKGRLTRYLCGQLTAKTIKRKDNATHPNSRRAHQLARVAHRENLIAHKVSARNKNTQLKSERHLTIVGLLDPQLAATDLAGMHSLIGEDFLSINQHLLEQERHARRAGRPPSAREAALAEACRKEAGEYDAGIDVPDLRNSTNVKLLREWNGDAQMLPLYDFVRVSRKNPHVAKVVQVGKHKELVRRREFEAKAAAAAAEPSGEVEMGDDTPAASTSA